MQERDSRFAYLKGSTRSPLADEKSSLEKALRKAYPPTLRPSKTRADGAKISSATPTEIKKVLNKVSVVTK